MASRRILILTGLAVALAGVTAVTAAERAPVHVMTVRLPDGGVEQIRYTGDVAPHVLVSEEAAPQADGSFDTAFGSDSPFAELDRISAEMDRQAEMMMQQAAMIGSTPDSQLHEAALAGAPAGTTSYTTVSSSNGQGLCTQSVRVISMGGGQAPKVERSSSGNCGAAPATPAAPAVVKPGPVPRDSI